MAQINILFFEENPILLDWRDCFLSIGNAVLPMPQSPRVVYSDNKSGWTEHSNGVEPNWLYSTTQPLMESIIENSIWGDVMQPEFDRVAWWLFSDGNGVYIAEYQQSRAGSAQDNSGYWHYEGFNIFLIHGESGISQPTEPDMELSGLQEVQQVLAGAI